MLHDSSFEADISRASLQGIFLPEEWPLSEAHRILGQFVGTVSLNCVAGCPLEHFAFPNIAKVDDR
jgi:hypothetical protein